MVKIRCHKGADTKMHKCLVGIYIKHYNVYAPCSVVNIYVKSRQYQTKKPNGKIVFNSPYPHPPYFLNLIQIPFFTFTTQMFWNEWKRGQKHVHIWTSFHKKIIVGKGRGGGIFKRGQDATPPAPPPIMCWAWPMTLIVVSGAQLL